VTVTRAAREAAHEAWRVVRGETATHVHLRDRISALAFFTVAVDLVASVVVLLLERHAASTEISNYGDAVFWVSSQLLTVSSSIMNPISPGARVIDVLLEIYAITVVTALAGSFAAFFHRRSRERDAAAARRNTG